MISLFTQLFEQESEWITIVYLYWIYELCEDLNFLALPSAFLMRI